tara:strand:- start:300 stop:731 length:432 start_codon:yes stop_codon:yes gene_type:complete
MCKVGLHQPQAVYQMSKIPWEKVISFSGLDITKLILTALVVLFVTKIQVFSDRLSALLVALPLTSLLAMIWMRLEKQDPERIANHAEGTFWFVLPTLPMFLVLPWMLRNGWGFGIALAVNCVLTVVLFFGLVAILKPFGIKLL